MFSSFHSSSSSSHLPNKDEEDDFFTSTKSQSRGPLLEETSKQPHESSSATKSAPASAYAFTSGSQPAPSTTTTATVTTSYNAPSSSWKEAHSRYCRHHGRLRASLQDVVQDECGDDNVELPWESPRQSQVVTEISQLTLNSTTTKSSNNAPEQATSVSSSVLGATSSLAFGLAKSVASTLYSTVLGASSETITEEELHDEDDDAYASSRSNPPDSTPDFWTRPIIQAGLIHECIDALKRHARLVQSKQEPTTTGATGEIHPIVLRRSQWTSFLGSAATSSSFSLLSQLPLQDKWWLLEVLLHHRLATVHVAATDKVATPSSSEPSPSDILVLSLESPLPTNTNDKVFQALNVQVSLFELDEAKTKLEAQLDGWAQQVHETRQKALKYKKQGQQPLALAQLAKAKSLQSRIDAAAPSLLNLELVQGALETAHSNQSLVSILSQGNQVLKTLNQTMSKTSNEDEDVFETIHDLQDDLQEEVQQSHNIHEALVGGTSTSSADQKDEDEELLKELQAMMISSPADSTETNNKDKPIPSGRKDPNEESHQGIALPEAPTDPLPV